MFNVPLADSALTADSGIAGLTVEHAGHDSLCNHHGDLGNYFGYMIVIFSF